jgi:hypothetical protein
MIFLLSVATTSFVILLLFSLPSCLHLRATPFSAEGVGACVSSPYSSDTSPDTDSCSGYCTSMITFHIMRPPSFSPSSDARSSSRPSPYSSSPFCCSHTVAAASQPTLVSAGTTLGASRSCSWPFAVRVVEEDMVVPATLRLSWR